MKTALTYGFALALGGSLLTLLLFFAGFHETPEKLQTAQWIGMAGGVALGVAALTLAMREKRASFPSDETWGYGNALGAGALTALFGSLFGAILGYLYFAIINPGMTDVMLDAQILALEAKGLSAAQIERSEPIMRKWITPPVLALMQLFFGFLWNFILALLIAIFLRDRPLTAPADSPPSL